MRFVSVWNGGRLPGRHYPSQPVRYPALIEMTKSVGFNRRGDVIFWC